MQNLQSELMLSAAVFLLRYTLLLGPYIGSYIRSDGRATGTACDYNKAADSTIRIVGSTARIAGSLADAAGLFMR